MLTDLKRSPLFLRLTLLFLLSYRPLQAVERITLYVGESKVLPVEGAHKIVVGNPLLMDARSLSDQELLLTSKAAGLSSLLFWDDLGEKKAYEVEVLSNAVKRTLIEVDVEVLEIADGANWDLGLNWADIMAGQPPLAPGLPGAPTQVLEQSPGLLSFGAFQRGPLGARLDLLVQQNKARIVARPRLMTVSGGSAKFLSGGQIPVAQQDTLGHTHTEYKDYGVSLDISPKADDDGNVNATIRAEMSDIDPANSVTLAGGVLPAIKTRWVETTIFVKKDGTLVIAGLLQENDGKVTAGIPLLSLIPVLGELFKHTEITHKTTELVIFVTPKVLGT
jgi:pilus assembly protein CpaC